MRWVRVFVSILAGAAALALVVWAFLPDPVEVQVAVVARGAFEQWVEEDGKTRVRERYVVSAPLAGKLERIALKAGDRVEKDQVVARLTPAAPALLDARTERELTERLGAARAATLKARAEAARAQAALDMARSDQARIANLAQRGYVSPAERERAESAMTVKQRETEAAQQALHAAEHDEATARAALMRVRGDAPRKGAPIWEIRAPVAGRVLKVMQESEGMVAAGASLLELADPADLEVVVDLLTTDAVQIRPGFPAAIEGWGGPQALEGRVQRVEPGGFTKLSALGVEEQRTNVVIGIVSPPEQWVALGDGYRVDARIAVFRQEDAVKVPVAALFREGEAWKVFVANEGRAHRREVKIARRGRLEALVEQGLQPGERVIVYPSDAVKDGVRLKETPTDTAAGP